MHHHKVLHIHIYKSQSAYAVTTLFQTSKVVIFCLPHYCHQLSPHHHVPKYQMHAWTVLTMNYACYDYFCRKFSLFNNFNCELPILSPCQHPVIPTIQCLHYFAFLDSINQTKEISEVFSKDDTVVCCTDFIQTEHKNLYR